MMNDILVQIKTLAAACPLSKVFDQPCATGLFPYGASIQTLLAVAALVLCVGLNWSPPRAPLFRRMIAIAAWLSCLTISACPFRYGLDWRIAILAGIGIWTPTFWLLAKILLSGHFALLRDARFPSKQKQQFDLLPFQSNAQKALFDQIVESQTPVALGLQGEWGSGKSTVIQSLKNVLNKINGFAAIPVNIWEFEHYDDLQFGAFQALLSHPKVIKNGGWLVFPLWILPREWGRINIEGLKFCLGKTSADANGSLHLPWQNSFERVIGHMEKRGIKVVFILDEIDRASASTVQRALTLVTRSLSLPNVVTVIPYVDEVIRFKAFHPSVVKLDDLRDTITAVLNQLWMDGNDQLSITAEQRAKQEGQNPLRFIQRNQETLFKMLSLRFMETADESMWLNYYQRMSEKYLRLRIYIGRPNHEDLIEFVDIADIKLLFERFGEKAIEYLKARIKQLHDNGVNPYSSGIPAQFRGLKGDLMKIIPCASDAKGLDPLFFLTLAIAMSDDSWLI